MSSCVGGTGNKSTDVGSLTGSPVWVSGSGPLSFAGVALAAGSKGIGGASDGTNMGVELPVGYRYPR